jgi:hypothetical protein
MKSAEDAGSQQAGFAKARYRVLSGDDVNSGT